MRGPAILLSSLLAWAQPPPQTSKPATVEGRVHNAVSGDPVRKARVRLQPVGARGMPLEAQTDAGGLFRIEAVQPGQYYLTADRPGFAPPKRRNTLTIEAGQELRGLAVAIPPHAVVTGRVFDEDGDPIQYVSVQLHRLSYVNGKRQLMPMQSATTNDLGEYRIAAIPAGRYYVNATKPESMTTRYMFGGAVRARPAGEQQAYVPVFFPGTPDPAAATRLEIGAGQELAGIDVRLRKERVYHVRGRVIGIERPASGRGNFSNIFVLPSEDGAWTTARSRRPYSLGRDGTFDLAGVRPGSYHLFIMEGGRGHHRSARVPIVVAESDLENVEVTLADAAPLKGEVIAEGTAPPELQQVAIHMTPLDAILAPVADGMIHPEAGGAFVTAPLDAGRYRVSVSGLPEGYFLKSVKLGEQEITDTGLDLALGGASGELRLVIASGAPLLQGTVQNSRGDPAPNVTVTLLPEKKAAGWDDSRVVPTDQNGSFRVAGLRPGTWRVYAWEEIESGAHLDPDFLRPFENEGVKVELEQHAERAVALKVIATAK